MSATEEVIYERTCAMTGRKIREPFTFFPDLPMTVYIEGDDPLLDIYPPAVVDQWNEKVRLNIESGGEIERREIAANMAAMEAVRANLIYDTPAFMPDDYIAELPPPDVLARWAAEAKITPEMNREFWNGVFRAMIENRSRAVK